MCLDWCVEADGGKGHNDKAEKWEAFQITCGFPSLKVLSHGKSP